MILSAASNDWDSIDAGYRSVSLQASPRLHDQCLTTISQQRVSKRRLHTEGQPAREATITAGS